MTHPNIHRSGGIAFGVQPFVALLKAHIVCIVLRKISVFRFKSYWHVLRNNDVVRFPEIGTVEVNGRVKNLHQSYILKMIPVI